MSLRIRDFRIKQRIFGQNNVISERDDVVEIFEDVVRYLDNVVLAKIMSFSEVITLLGPALTLLET